MIERRNIAVCIVLTLVTCGIYGIYWIVCLTNDVNTVSGDVNGTSGGFVSDSPDFWIWNYCICIDAERAE